MSELKIYRLGISDQHCRSYVGTKNVSIRNIEAICSELCRNYKYKDKEFRSNMVGIMSEL